MQKRLYRSDQGKIAGVCGGLAEYFNVDPSWVRIAFAVSIFLGGFGIILYILMWLIVPLKSRL